MGKISSETIWHLGLGTAVNVLLEIIKENGGQVREVKISRVDLCTDVLMDRKGWSKSLIPSLVTRSRYRSTHEENDRLQGFQIGKGEIVARIYDKALEIAQASKKDWFFEKWELPDLPDHQTVIRVEFQLRREGIKQLGVSTFEDLLKDMDKVWAYCSREWLKLMDSPGRHVTQRSTLPWWRTVQDTVFLTQLATPAVRRMAMAAEENQLKSQGRGFFTSYLCLQHEQGNFDLEAITPEGLSFHMSNFLLGPAPEEDIRQGVLEKRAKYQRLRLKAGDGEGLPPAPENRA